MLKRTPLYHIHKATGAKLVPFAGWEMPLQYTSIIEEHTYVRQDAGVFDVSHMRAIDLHGKDVIAFLRYLLANDIQKLTTDGQALYGCMLNESAGILDDLITYRINARFYRLVVNAGTTDKDLDWIKTHALGYDVTVTPRDDLAMLAVQGPHAVEKLAPIFPADVFATLQQLSAFHAIEHQDYFIAKTGYTGESGVEILLPNQAAETFWQQLCAQNIHPAGLGARDTLRLEAGLNLYGQDMDESVTPLMSNLAWTVDLKDPTREFVGKAAYVAQKQQGGYRKLVGVVLQEKGVLRNHLKLYRAQDDVDTLGEITSGTFSPSLQQGIGFARIEPLEASTCWVEIRGKRVPLQIIKPPFIKAGRANFDSLRK